MLNIRKILLYSAVLILLVSCVKVEETYTRTFEPNLFYGKWVSGSEFYRFDYAEIIDTLGVSYAKEGRGVYWDTADDVTEEEAQAFQWEYKDWVRGLTIIHWMEMTQDWTVPRVYLVKQLNDSLLVFEDRFGQTYSFNKITDTVAENGK